MLCDGKPERIAEKWLEKHEGATLFPVQSLTNIDELMKVVVKKAKITKKVLFYWLQI